MKLNIDKDWLMRMVKLEEDHEVGAGSPHHFLRNPFLHIQFKKPIDRFANMTNGQLRIFFTDESELVVNFNPKRGIVIPRRKRAYARSIGVI